MSLSEYRIHQLLLHFQVLHRSLPMMDYIRVLMLFLLL
jgi:hypothetical protein